MKKGECGIGKRRKMERREKRKEGESETAAAAWLVALTPALITVARLRQH